MSHLPLSPKILSRADATARLALLVVVGLGLLMPGPVAAQKDDIATRIASLSALDFQTRMNAARLIRREPASAAVAALRDAVTSHPDEYVRYRAFVILTSFNDPETPALVRSLLRDRNDRLREVAYKWLEMHPDTGLASTLLAALQTERAEFVRPALVGALAALGDNPQVQRALSSEITRGVDFFRSAVIDALGRHRAAYAVEAIAGVAALEGPLQDDAVLALGRIGGERAKAALAGLTTASTELSLNVRAAQCLAGEPCEPALKALVTAAASPSSSPAVMRAAAGGLGTLAADGNQAATAAIVSLAERGGAVRDQAALAFAAAAVRNPGHLIAWLDAAPDAVRGIAVDLLRDGFEDLEEDFGEEQFFAAARASYWKAAEGSDSRTMAATLIQKLDF